jgi:hypothetical protein
MMKPSSRLAMLLGMSVASGAGYGCGGVYRSGLSVARCRCGECAPCARSIEAARAKRERRAARFRTPEQPTPEREGKQK